jgi:hypothetical protein
MYLATGVLTLRGSAGRSGLGLAMAGPCSTGDIGRGGHGVSLTPAGETLVGLVTPIVRDAEHASEEMARLDGRVSGRVKIGLISSVAQSTLAVSFATIAQRYPEVELSACAHSPPCDVYKNRP